jgi:hypothetical protein
MGKLNHVIIVTTPESASGAEEFGVPALAGLFDHSRRTD